MKPSVRAENERLTGFVQATVWFGQAADRDIGRQGYPGVWP
jgi:hypothetical protein